MIFCCWKRFDKPIAERLPSNFPTLLGWVYFWGIFWKIRQLNRFLMPAKVIIYNTLAMRLVIVSKKKKLPPSFPHLFKEHNKFSSLFSFMKTENKTIFASRTENIRALVAISYFHNGTTSSSHPPALDKRDEAECGFILCAHNKPFGMVVSCFPLSFFLKRSISSSLGRR